MDEGFLVGAAVISLTDTEDVLPVDEEVEVLMFDFVVLSEASAGQSDLVFLDNGWRQSGGLVKNKLIAGGTDITPALASSFVFVNGRINIVPDGTPFVRGDSNGDGGVNISDPTFTLNHLFLGAARPWCLDAADANDDGKLDISDAIATLQYLFLGGAALPPPIVAPGADPTDDALGICI